MGKTSKKDAGVILSIKVETRSQRPGIVGAYGDGLKVRLKSPPVKGRANKELIEVLSEELGIPKGNVEIVSGETSRNKRVRLRGVSMERIRGFQCMKGD